VREMLGGHGTVFSRDGCVGARFDSVGWSDNYKLLTNQGVKIGSGGVLCAVPQAPMSVRVK